MRTRLFIPLAALLLLVSAIPGSAGPKRWSRTARIAATEFWVEMTDRELRKAIDKLANQGVSAVDIDLSSEPIARQVKFVKRVLAYARGAHPKMRFFVYQAPLEAVSENVDRNHDGKVDPGKTSMFTEHPRWAQRGLGDEPAVVYGAAAGAFWVGPDDEDLWLCPNDPDYKKQWSDEISRLVATGVDGIYVDVPIFRGWFDDKRGWRWACACEDCAAIYKAQYGADPPKREDWSDPNFRRFIRFRFQQIKNFIAELKRLVKNANPKALLIIEHWDGLGDATESACDPALIARHSDLRCHEWANADGSSSDYSRYAWLEDMVRYLYYRSVDGGQPSWILAYTDRKDDSRMRALAALQLSAGCNLWETDAPDMAGSVDGAARTKLFGWISRHSALYYRKRIEPLERVALLFSRDSVTFHDYRARREPWRCAREFLGIGMILLQLHIPYRVITPADLDSLEGIEVLVLPNTACMSGPEAEAVRRFARAGGTVVSTGDTGEFDEDGEGRGGSILKDLFGTGDPGSGFKARPFGAGKVVFTGRRMGFGYYLASSPSRRRPKNEPEARRQRTLFRDRVWSRVPGQPVLKTDAGPFTVLLPYRNGKSLQIRAFRINGIDDGVLNVSSSIKLPAGMLAGPAVFEPFLKNSPVPLSRKLDGKHVSAVLPLQMHGVAVFRLKLTANSEGR